MIRVQAGKDNPVKWKEPISFDIHDATSGAKIGYLAGYMPGPWSGDAPQEQEFRVVHTEITAPDRRLSPGEWRAVRDGLRDLLPDAEVIGWNPGGEGGDLFDEKLYRLRERLGPEMPEPEL